MKKEEPAISQARMEELLYMSKGLYCTICGLTADPFEAVTVLTMIHLMLWMNNRQGDCPTEQMLADYTKNFLDNFNANEVAFKGELN
jgi:hypothetical protein